MPKGEKKAGGRPKTVKRFSEAVKRRYEKAAAKIKKETGQDIEEHLLRMIIGFPCPLCEQSGKIENHGKNSDTYPFVLCIGCHGKGSILGAQDTAIVGVGKLYNEALLIKESEQTINDKRQGPTIGLPPVIPVPKRKDEEEHPRLHG